MDRNLDAQIVKTIFNWRYIPVSSDADGQNKCEILYPPGKEPDQDFYNTLPRMGKLHEGWNAPRYSDDLRLAIELAKHIKLPISVVDMPMNPQELSKMCLDYFIMKG